MKKIFLSSALPVGILGVLCVLGFTNGGLQERMGPLQLHGERDGNAACSLLLTRSGGGPFMRFKDVNNEICEVQFAQGLLHFSRGDGGVFGSTRFATNRLIVTGKVEQGSSRELKENIRRLSGDNAMNAVMALDAVTFNYKTDPNSHSVGFIAEDVPGLVASSDRKTLSAMDITAALTKVVQEQQRQILILRKEVEALKKGK